MAKQVQFRRGTTSQHSTFTGAVGEVTVDTDKDVVVVHDGSTAGGFPLARQLSDLGVTASAADLNATDVTTLGTVEASKVVTADANGDVTFSANDKIQFGNGNDLQIYHDGSNSIISDQGTGDLNIQSSGSMRLQNSAASQNYIFAADGGAVQLHYAGNIKIATTSTGIDVTGTAEVDTLQFSDGSTQTSAGASTGKAIAMAIVFGG